MLYVAQLTWHDHLGREDREGALVRRATWEPPTGLEVVGEYWLAADGPHVVTVFRAESYEPIMELIFFWNDVFDVAVSPATTPEEGLQIGPGVLERVAAAQAA